MKFFNLKNGLSLEQIFLLSEMIIDESESDNLSIQDVYLLTLNVLISHKLKALVMTLQIFENAYYISNK